MENNLNNIISVSYDKSNDTAVLVVVEDVPSKYRESKNFPLTLRKDLHFYNLADKFKENFSDAEKNFFENYKEHTKEMLQEKAFTYKFVDNSFISDYKEKSASISEVFKNMVIVPNNKSKLDNLLDTLFYLIQGE